MNIHPFWYICISIRLLLILSIRYFYKNRLGKYLSLLVLIGIGLGFLRKALIGSNNEIQIAKVFWHETRYVHGILYILSAIYLYYDNLKVSLLLLLLDIIFSIIYRISINI